MSAENESKPTPPEAHRSEPSGNASPSQAGEGEPQHALSAQAQRDEEIAAIQQHARHQPPGIQKPPDVPPAPPGKALTIVGVLLLVLLIAGALTLWSRASHESALAKETERSTVPTVAVIHPLAEKPDEDLVLPGSLQAYEESPIYARTSGYLLHWYKDIGSRVNKGELLAKIDTPEVDQELNQSRAAREQIVAQMDLAKISSDRWENLRKTDSVSAQEADQYASAYKQAQANLAAADANVRRLEQLEGFKDVYAPFFKVGAGATVTLQEFPGQKFSAKVARTAESIDPVTRTLLTEVDVPNKDGRLYPGSFGEVHFKVGSDVNKVTVPVNTMLFRAEGPRLAVIGSEGKVQLRPINIGRDYGATLEILGGVSPDDQVVVNPADSLEDGQQVNVAQAAPDQQQQSQPPAQNNKSKAQQKGSAK